MILSVVGGKTGKHNGACVCGMVEDRERERTELSWLGKGNFCRSLWAGEGCHRLHFRCRRCVRGLGDRENHLYVVGRSALHWNPPCVDKSVTRFSEPTWATLNQVTKQKLLLGHQWEASQAKCTNSRGLKGEMAKRGTI